MLFLRVISFIINLNESLGSRRVVRVQKDLFMKKLLILIALLILMGCLSSTNDEDKDVSETSSSSETMSSDEEQSSEEDPSSSLMSSKEEMSSSEEESSSSVYEPSFDITANVHYRVLTDPIPIGSPDKIAVTEFFWYGCPHCKAFEPMLKEWESNTGDDVELLKQPVPGSDTWTFHAKIFFIRKSIETQDNIDSLLFDFTSNIKPLTLDSQAVEYKKFFEQYGINGEEFDTLMESKEMELFIQRSRDIRTMSGINGTPTMTVNNKYVVLLDSIKRLEDILYIVDNLVEMTRKDDGIIYVSSMTELSSSSMADTTVSSSSVNDSLSSSEMMSSSEEMSSSSQDSIVAYEEGTHFRLLPDSMQVRDLGDTSRITVTEFFWYGCSRCLEFNPLIHDLTDNHPDSVELYKIPLNGLGVKELHAQIYYIRKSIDTEDNLDSMLFDLTVNNIGTESKEEQIVEYKKLFENYGMTSEEFDTMLESDELADYMNSIDSLAARLNITTTPLVIVDGRYRVLAGGFEEDHEMIPATDYLIQYAKEN